MPNWRAAPVAALLALAACGGGADDAVRNDWRDALTAGDGVGAEIGLRDALAKGAPPDQLAPYLGEAELLQGDLVEARKWLGDGRFAAPDAPHGFHMLGRLQMREGDLPAAGRAFDRALRIAPDDPGLWVDIARLRYSGGEQAQALAAADKALALGPRNSDAMLLQAQLKRDALGHAAALPLLKSALAIAPANADLLAEYAATLGELGRAGDMLAAVRRLAAAAPGDRRALFLQAVLAARAGQHDLARELLQRSGDLDRAMPAATLLLAVVDLDNGNPASAAQGLDRLLQRQPDNVRVARLLALALFEAGNDRELVARFGARSDDRYFAALVGRAYERLGERERAAPFLDRAFAAPKGPRLAIIPPSAPLGVTVLRTNADGATTVAVVRGLLAARRAGDARSVARNWLGRHPGSAEALALAGDAALAARDPRAALEHYRRAARIRRPWPLVKRMAAALEMTGQQDQAAALVAAYLAGEPTNAEAAGLLARRGPRGG